VIGQLIYQDSVRVITEEWVPQRAPRCVLVAALLLTLNLSASAAQNVPDPQKADREDWVQSVLESLDKRKQRLNSKASAALRILEKAEEAYSLAGEVADQAAAEVARRAMDKARSLFERAKQTVRVIEIKHRGFARLGAIDGRQAYGAVLQYRGRVSVQRSGTGEWEPPGSRSGFQWLRPGDRVRTGRDSRLILHLGDGQVVTLGGATEFILEQPEMGLLTKGRLFFEKIVHKRRSPFVIRTPHVTTAVRGTEFVMDSGEGGTQVVVLEGELEVTPSGAENAIPVSAGQSLTVWAGKGAPRLDTVEPQTVSRWWEEGFDDAGTSEPIAANQLRSSPRKRQLNASGTWFPVSSRGISR
jgi:ferric-dicitrate binding protein FerR (iron transport regulator)